MDGQVTSEWLEDDLFDIETHSLFRPNEDYLASHNYSPFSTSSEFLEPFTSTTVDPACGIFDSGYISSNSSDSGKHSPSGSESTTDQGSPWVFPPPFQTFPIDHNYDERRGSDNTESSRNYAPIAPRPSPNTQTVLTPSAKKYLYLVPTSTASKVPSLSNGTQAVSLHTSIASNYHANNPTVYMKTEHHSVYTNSENVAAPIYISQATGSQLQPISVPAQKILVSRETYNDSEVQKIEDRKAKNRAAAQASRVKKRNEVDDLKRTVNTLKAENERLTAENGLLRQILFRYERPQEEGAPTRKRMAVAGTMMMAVFLVMAVNPINFTTDTSAKPAALPRTNKYLSGGRILDTDVVSTFPLNNSAKCTDKKFYNKTETIKLNNDLYEWVDRHEAMGLGLKGKRRLLQKKQDEWLTAVGNMRVNITDAVDKNNTKVEQKASTAKAAKGLWRHLDMISVSGGSVRERRERARKLIKNGQPSYNKKIYERLTSAIQQKDDTLYVVALEDYFLLPALERNFTTTPKVTLILPALSYNSSVSGKVPLMRIDLRVVGTGLFQLSRQLLPPFLQ